MKQLSKQWVGRRELASKKVKSVSSAGKVMASVFWNLKGILHIDYLEKGKGQIDDSDRRKTSRNGQEKGVVRTAL